ncbi:PorT family protein [Puteibacter caeruleilacunae]|nr:PorT family protein [Puteibacter caeruleilacunae]
MKDDLKFDKLMQSRLNNLELEPPGHIWENVDAAVSRRRRVVVWWRSAGVAAAVIVLALVIGQLWNQQGDISNVESIAQVEKEQSKEIEEAVSSEDISSEKEVGEKDAVEGEVVATDVQTESKQILLAKSIEAGNIEEKDSGSRGKVINNNLFDEIREELSQLMPHQSDPMPIDNQLLADMELEQARKSKQETEDFLTEAEKIIVARNLQFMNMDKKVNKERKKEKKVEDLQPRKQKERRTDIWSVGVQYGKSDPSNVSQGGRDYAAASYDSNAGSRNSVKELKVTNSMGVSVELRRSKRLSFSSGIFYSKFNQGTNGTTVRSNYSALFSGKGGLNAVETTATQWSTQSAWGRVNIKSPTNEKVQSSPMAGAPEDLFTANISYSTPVMDQQAEYLELPLMVRYRLVDKKVAFSVVGGMSANFLIGNNVYLGSGAARFNAGSTSDLKDISYSGTVGFGMNYGLFSNLSFNIEPKLKYFISPLSDNPHVDFQPWVVGIYAGINYTF